MVWELEIEYERRVISDGKSAKFVHGWAAPDSAQGSPESSGESGFRAGFSVQGLRESPVSVLPRLPEIRAHDLRIKAMISKCDVSEGIDPPVLGVDVPLNFGVDSSVLLPPEIEWDCILGTNQVYDDLYIYTRHHLELPSQSIFVQSRLQANSQHTSIKRVSGELSGSRCDPAIYIRYKSDYPCAARTKSPARRLSVNPSTPPLHTSPSRAGPGVHRQPRSSARRMKSDSAQHNVSVSHSRPPAPIPRHAPSPVLVPAPQREHPPLRPLVPRPTPAPPRPASPAPSPIAPPGVTSPAHSHSHPRSMVGKRALVLLLLRRPLPTHTEWHAELGPCEHEARWRDAMRCLVRLPRRRWGCGARAGAVGGSAKRGGDARRDAALMRWHGDAAPRTSTGVDDAWWTIWSKGGEGRGGEGGSGGRGGFKVGVMKNLCRRLWYVGASLPREGRNVELYVSGAECMQSARAARLSCEWRLGAGTGMEGRRAICVGADAASIWIQPGVLVRARARVRKQQREAGIGRRKQLLPHADLRRPRYRDAMDGGAYEGACVACRAEQSPAEEEENELHVRPFPFCSCDVCHGVLPVDERYLGGVGGGRGRGERWYCAGGTCAAFVWGAAGGRHAQQRTSREAFAAGHGAAFVILASRSRVLIPGLQLAECDLPPARQREIVLAAAHLPRPPDLTPPLYSSNLESSNEFMFVDRCGV
ncbi:hypothetical protein DFH09DRAFT_1094384 [Mycena vulgaris]|nr:hypothetical protein DFH09DRAFT_1094384 [Mycena vulgaris]